MFGRLMEQQMQEMAEKAVAYAEDCGVQYCDARAEQHTVESGLVTDGQVEHIKTRHDGGIGVRMLHGGAWGFCSITSPGSFADVAAQIDRAIRRASRSSQSKQTPAVLAPMPQSRARIEFPVQKKPEMQELVRIAQECSDIIMQKRDVIKTTVSPSYTSSSKYFASSQGSSILQSHTDTVIHMAAVAHGFGQTQSVDTTEGGRGGVEQIMQDSTYDEAGRIAEKASQLLHARPIRQQEATLVMDPDFVSLLTHEILGHPSEADRILGREMAWAGGAWWGGKLGQKIGSDCLNVFDDPTIKQSLGWYYFDDEGARAEKTTLVKSGVLERHMQSRETASMFDGTPTGNMRASNYRFMPLIRMACTCIAAGSHGADEIIKEVSDGYMVSGMKVPSIDSDRYNWSISCQYAQKIENGELASLHRDVIVAGTAPDFFASIDACGRDFKVRPITNCGKGDPMQQLAMGNGGPTIRGTATVKSVV